MLCKDYLQLATLNKTVHLTVSTVNYQGYSMWYRVQVQDLRTRATTDYVPVRVTGCLPGVELCQREDGERLSCSLPRGVYAQEAGGVYPLPLPKPRTHQGHWLFARG